MEDEKLMEFGFINALFLFLLLPLLIFVYYKYNSSKNFQKQYKEIRNERIKSNQKNMNRIGVDMINLSNEESFDITINKYFRKKWKMKN